MASLFVSFKFWNPSSKHRMWAEWKPGDINTDKIPKAVATIPRYNDGHQLQRWTQNNNKQIPLSWSIISRSEAIVKLIWIKKSVIQLIFWITVSLRQKKDLIKPSSHQIRSKKKTLPSVPCNFLLWPWSVCSNPWWSQWTSQPKSWDESSYGKAMGKPEMKKWNSGKLT